MVIADIAGANMVKVKESGSLPSGYDLLKTVAKALAQPGKTEDPLLSCLLSTLISPCPYLKNIHSTDREDIPNFLKKGHICIEYSTEAMSEKKIGRAIAEIKWFSGFVDEEEGRVRGYSHKMRVILERSPFHKSGHTYFHIFPAVFIPQSGQWYEIRTS